MRTRRTPELHRQPISGSLDRFLETDGTASEKRRRMTSRGWRLPARDRRLARLDRPVSREVDVVGGWKWCLDPRARATDWSVGTFEGGIRRQRRKNNKNEEREDLTYSRHVWRGASPTTLVAAPARAPSRRLTPGQSSNPPPRVTSPRDDAYLLQLNVVQLLIVGYVVVKPVSFSISTLLSPDLLRPASIPFIGAELNDTRHCWARRVTMERSDTTKKCFSS